MSTSGVRLPLPALEWVLVPAAALRAAAGTGLLGAIAARDGAVPPVENVARGCDLDPHRTAVLLEVLADAGLVERFHGAYRAHPDTARFGDLMASMLGDLAASMASDRTGEGPRPDLYPKVVGSLGTVVADAAARVAAILAAPGIHVVDLGAGAAPWSLAILEREPTARLTAVDRTEVLPATGAAIEAAGVGNRAEPRAADLTVDELPSGADVVLLAHVCHLFGDDVAATIVRRAAASVAPGGCLAVIDFVDDPDAGKARRAALRRYELGLFARTADGRLRDLETLRSWCRAGGLGHHEVHDLDGSFPMTLLVARHAPR